MHSRLKCGDNRFTSNFQPIFHVLDWIERNAGASSIHFSERKQFESDIRFGQMVNKHSVKRMICNDHIF